MTLPSVHLLSLVSGSFMQLQVLEVRVLSPSYLIRLLFMSLSLLCLLLPSGLCSCVLTLQILQHLSGLQPFSPALLYDLSWET